MNKISNIGHSLFERAMSSFPISIGTGLALESIEELNPTINTYDESRRYDKFSIKEYSSFFINVETLYRNLSSSVDSHIFTDTKASVCYEVLFNEMEFLLGLFGGDIGNDFKLIFYYSDYSKLEKASKDLAIPLRIPNTINQKVYRSKFVEVIKMFEKDKNGYLTKTNGELMSVDRNPTLIMTHQIYDLLSYKNFLRLDLLESHTGKLKTKSLWNSKFITLGDSDLSILPFNFLSVMTFGDKYLIQPSPIKLRKLLFEIATKRNWNPNTTMDKIKFDIDLDVKEPMVKEYLRKLCAKVNN